MYKKLKDWLSTFASVKNTPVATLALMKAVDVLKSQEKAGNINHQEKTELHKYLMEVLEIEV